MSADIQPGDVADLIARLEAATGPDRELDALCAIATKQYPTVSETWIGGPKRQFDSAKWYAAPNGYIQHPDWHYDSSGPGKSQSARYTASIDAALTLHSGWVHLYKFDDSVNDRAVVGFGDDDPCGEGRGVNPAIALCIAALKARLPLETQAT